MEFDKRLIGVAVFVVMLVVGLVVLLTSGSAGESDVDAGACNCDGGVDVVGDGGVAAVESVVTDEAAEVVPAATETTVTTDSVVTAGSEVTVTAPAVTETATTGTAVTATTPR